MRLLIAGQLLLLCAMAVHGQDAPTVTLGPAQVTGTREIVSGSDIQLFCSATSTSGVAPDISWTGNGETLENTPPSRYFRTSSDGTTATSSVLTIEDFQSADDGTYFCSGSIPASGGGTVAGSSGTAVLTAVTFIGGDANAITLSRDPISREDRSDAIADNRVSVALGTQFDPATTGGPDQLMVAAAILASFRNLEAQSIVWVKDGVVIAENGIVVPPMVDPMTADPRYTLVATAADQGGTGLWRTVLTISGFQASDAGVYQVIFTDAVASNSEVLTTTPVRLDTDGPATLVRVSPAIIDLVLGEPLLIEVSASGGYEQLNWTRNGAPLSGTFVSHDEVYYQASSDITHLGEYSITATPGGPTVTVAVLEYTTPTTDILNATIEVMEGGSVNIVCTSTGIPTPTIEWELDSGSLAFTPTDMAPVDPVITQPSPLMFSEGSLTSVLSITNAVFPDHQGTYRCTGTNSHDGVAASDADTVQVTVLVTPEVEVSATRTRIQLGGTVTLTCNVTRSSPSDSLMYTWTLLPGTTVRGPTPSTQSTDMLDVTFDALDDYGTYQCSVENGAGLTGMADTMIEQGFLPDVSITGGPVLPTPLSTVDLNCTAGNGDIPITYQWVDVANDGVTLSTDAMYTATVAGEVTYRCTATNDLGSVSAEVTVVEALPPVITPAGPTPVSVLVGGALTLEVNITGFNLPINNINWNFKSGVLTGGVDRISITTSADLTTPPVMSTLVRMPILSLEDEGNYDVTADNAAGNPVSIFTVTVLAPPTLTFPTASTMVTVAGGETATLTCSAFGSPAPVFEWLMDMTALVDGGLSGRVDITSSESMSDFFYVNSTLTISFVEESDASDYTCRATNSVDGVGVDETYTLTVNVQTEIIVEPVDTDAEYLSNVSLSCMAQGIPVPDFAWTVDSGSGSVDVMESGRISIITTQISINQQLSTLTLTSVKPTDTATYTCNANNSIGTDSGSAVLTVQAQPEVLSTVPVDPTTANVNIGNDIALTCTARGAPEPTFAWLGRSPVMELMDGDPGVMITTTIQSGVAPDFVTVVSTLMISMTAESDAGIYSCVASNMVFGEGRQDSEDFTLMINFPAMIVTSPADTDVLMPNVVNLTCAASGVPPANFTWEITYLDGSTVSLTESSGDITIMSATENMLTTSTLTIDPTERLDTGNYTCIAENDRNDNISVSDPAEVNVFVRPVIEFPTEGFTYEVLESNDTTFECNATGFPAPMITFSIAAERVTLLPPVMTPVGDGTYRVTQGVMVADAMDGDSGIYTCIASNTIPTLDPMEYMDSQDFEFLVLVAPTITTPPSSIPVTAPNDATFTCEVDGVRRPTITWWRTETSGSTQLSNGTKFAINEAPSGRGLLSDLTVLDTVPSDDTDYFCMATNEAGSSSADASLTVYVTPRFIAPLPTDQTVNETDDAIFICTAIGIPAPTISFYMGATLLDGMGSVEPNPRVILADPTDPIAYMRPMDGEEVLQVSRTLTISNTMNGDSGNYSCRATSDPIPDEDEVFFQLDVQTAPIIVDAPVNLTVVQPDDATFSCQANGRPRPAITWWRFTSADSDFVQITMSDPDYSVNETVIGDRDLRSNLTILGTMPGDTGEYLCQAENIISDAAESAFLAVQVVPQIIFTENYTVNQFEEVTFECRATGIPAPYINWYRNGDLLNEAFDSRISLSDPVMTPPPTSNDVYEVYRNLTFNSTRDDDTDTYTCVAGNGNAQMPNVTQNFELFVRVAPVILTPPEDLTVVAPEDATFFCEATARPGPNITWWRRVEGGDPVLLNDGIGYTILEGATGERIRNSTLTVVGTEPSDALDYICMASNMADEVEATAELTVHVVPEIIFTEDYTVNQFEEVTFECQATGIPAPYINWYRNGDLLDEDFDSRISLSDPVVTQPATSSDVYEVYRNLTFNSTRDDDTDTYTCVAGNGNARMPNTTQDFELFVRVAPMFLTPPENLTVVAPEDATFFCEATARPGPNITWWRRVEGGVPVLLNDGIDYSIVEGATGERIRNSTLTVNGTEPSDALDYFCRASNMAATVEATAELTVHVVPEIIFTEDYTVNQFEEVTFECRATGIPAPYINWYRNGDLLNEAFDSRISLSDPVVTQPATSNDVYAVYRSLTFNSTRDDDTDTYTCVASNGNARMPNVTQDFELFVRVAPLFLTPPENLTVVQPEDATFFCEATARPGPTITWWRVEEGVPVQLFDGIDYTIVEGATGERIRNSTLTVNGTEPSDALDYFCRARNMAGVVEATAELIVHVVPEIIFTEDYIVNQFEEVTFECRATGIPAPYINWYRNDNLLNEAFDSRISLSDPVVTQPETSSDVYEVYRTLTFNSTRDADTDTYTCVASNGNARMPNVTQNFELFVRVAPMILTPPENLTVVAPEDAAFFCEATARPGPAITWWRVEEGAPVQLFDGINYTIVEGATGERIRNSTLTVNGTEPSDALDYICMASNLVDMVEATAELTVHVVPEIIFTEDYTVNQFEEVTFECRATGIPAPYINWYRNGDLLDEDFDSRISLSDPVVTQPATSSDVYEVYRSLTFNSTRDDDTDTYTCVAGNGNARMPNVTQDFELFVRVAPMFLTPPEDLTVVAPEDATFFCEATARPGPNITWWRRVEGGDPVLMFRLDDGIDYTIVEGATGERIRNSTLTVNGTEPSDALDYICMASNMAGTVEATAELIVHVVPEIIFTEDYIVNQFEEVTFECRATGIPAPYINWYRNGVLLNEAFDSRISLSDPVVTQPATSNDVYEVYRNLTFNSTRDNDTDTYTCVASNGNARMPNVTQDFELFVRVAPVILTPPENLTVVAPEDATFFCEATARPGPTITWWRMEGGDPVLMFRLDDGIDYTIVEGATGERIRNSTLTVNGTEPSDALDYICMASNMAGTVEATAELIVHVVPEIIFTEDYIVNQFEEVTFECRATGIPAPYINWYRNGDLLDEAFDSRISLSDPVVTQPETSNDVYEVYRNLTFNSTRDDDTDTYTCVASNGNARMPNVTQDFELFVRVAPMFLTSPENLTVVTPEDATFFCEATARPGPTITWWRVEEDGNLTQLMNGTDYTIEDGATGERIRNSTLVVIEAEPSDAGTYVCVATNVVDSIEAFIILNVYVVPEILFPVDDTLYTINELQPATFECRATGIPAPYINWYRNGDLLNEAFDSRISLSELTVSGPMDPIATDLFTVCRTLTFNYTRDNDTDTYTCVASNGNARMPNVTQDFGLFVRVAPTFLTPPENLTVVAPEDATFFCEATARPGPDITWWRMEGGVPVLLNDGIDYTIVEGGTGERIRNSTLTVVGTEPSDALDYFCRASNVVNTAEATAELIVHVIPEIVFPGEGFSYTVNEFQPIAFVCTATGIPAPTISWYRNGVIFNETTNNRISISPPIETQPNDIFSVLRTLTIDPTRDSDSDTYTCVADNGNRQMPNDTLDFELFVRVAPVIMIPPEDLTVVSPEDATFFCQATARPGPDMTWWRVEEDGNRNQIMEALGEYNIVNVEIGERVRNSTLVVIGSQPSDTGTYLCQAGNVVAMDSATANLTVYVIPDIVFPEEDSFTYTVNVTDPVTFVCRARGVPVPIITWNRGGLPLTGTVVGSGGSDDLMFDMEDLNSRIVVDPPSQSLITTPDGSVYEAERNLTIYNTMGIDTGTYTCEADNGVQPNDTQDFELFVQVPPIVVSLADRREVIGNASDAVTLEFRIDNAAPLVALEDLTWYYSPSLVTMPQGEDITRLMNRTSQSMLTFSPFAENTMISLTVSNLVRDVAGAGETDEGRYFLVARNPAGISFDYTDLVIFGPPTILGPPEDQFEINDGSNATFVCGAFAFPLHELDWTFTDATGATTSVISTSDEQDTDKYSVNRSRETIVMFGALTVQDVQYEDRGRYTCTARNILGSDTASATLTVHVTPVIEAISATTEVNITNSASLACLTTAFPLVSSITWQKNGEELLLDLDGRISTFEFEINETYMSSGFLGSGSIESVVSMAGFTEAQVDGLGDLGVVGVLTFETVERDDTDSYTCTATNFLPETATLSTVSDPVMLVVLERPDPPVNVQVAANGALWVVIRWQPDFDGNRPIQQFVLYQRILVGEFTLVTTLDVGVPMFVEGFFRFNISVGIQAFTRYSFAVEACNELGCSEMSDASEEIRTDQYPATAPLNLAVVPGSVGQRVLQLQWDLPVMPNGIIARYRIYYSGTKQNDANFEDIGNTLTSTPNQMMMLTGLVPDTSYSITVAAINGAGEGDISTAVSQITDIAPPDAPPPISIPTEQTAGDRTYTIGIARPDDTNGPLSHYQVIAILLPTDSTLASNGLRNPETDYPTLQSLLTNTYDGLSECIEPTAPQAYIAAEFSDNDFPSNGQYIVGLETQPNDQSQYRNGPLCYSVTYTFFLRTYPVVRGTQKRQTGDRQYTLFSSSDYTPTYVTPGAPASIIGIVAGVIAGVIVVVVIILIVVICYCIYRRRRVYVYKTTTLEIDHDTTFVAAADNLKLTEYNAPVEGTLVRQPIPVAALAAHVDRMHANENCGFGEEYKVIQENSPKNSVEACIAPDNKPRNRYANIQCFDHSRVHLDRIEGFEHDYINGNFIHGYNHKNEYIATQGPLPDTVGDFWRLVWDHDCATIIMLTNLVEKMKVKCTQYWPNSGTQQYSNIIVTLKDSTIHADFVIRHFQIKNGHTEETKEVRQFHFISWPDFGVPRHATPLLYFLRRIRTAHPYSNQQPILIHCSAGVGRTGSLISIDVELQRARQEGVVDPFNFVLKLRQQRNHMVQTEAQYVFIHDAILEGITSGNTEITVNRLGQRMAELEQTDSDGETGYQAEFNRLRQFKVNVREFTDANDDANKFKNRIANALPYNYNRVHLQMSPGVGGSDYINASYVDGYAQKGAYIATQGPLPNTTEDFWRMVWEKDVHVVVMLTQLEEKGKDQCDAYWPESTNSPEKYGSLTVELLSESTYEDYVARELKLTDVTATTASSRTVRQFHFQAWPENGAPASGVGMIDLVDQVTRAQQQTGNKAIVIHCSAGIGRTGAFCALSLAIERVKAEGLVDIFHTIKHLRTQRPHMVQTVQQYIFCYRAIKEYVDSLSQYSNFQ